MKKKIRFLVVFGPTEEPIDPVRYISNRSTGTMGRCLISAGIRRGHTVVSVECPQDARTARELGQKLRDLLPECDVLIMAAAVCDARPAVISRTKIKKNCLSSIKLVKNPDILAGLAKRKKKGQIFIGFGLESEKLLENGLKKLNNKCLELIVLQRVTSLQDPFGNKKIEVFVLDRTGGAKRFSPIDKRKLANFLILEAERLREDFTCKNKRD